MNSVKKAFIFCIFTLLSHAVYAQTELCNSVYNFLKSNKLNPVTQQIVSSDLNQFPYNLSVTFDSLNVGENHYFDTEKNLYLIFNQDEVLQYKDLFLDIFSLFKTNDFNFNTTFLFLYGENQIIEKENPVYGLDSFIKEINTNEDSTCIFINFNNLQTSVISTSGGTTAPAWLIKNEHDIFNEYHMNSNLPFYYISQLYKYTFIQNRQLNSFFEINIPAIILNFNNAEIENSFSQKTVANIIKDSILSFSKASENSWQQHFLMISIMGKYRLISEDIIVRIIIIIFLCFLLFIALLGFINTNFKFEAWEKIKKIWYVVPVTFAITFISFFIGKFFIFLIAKNTFPAKKIFILFTTQLILSFILNTLYFIPLIFMNSKYELRSIDFLILITIVINQFIFLFYDVSLYPVFILLCILAIFSLLVKNNISHIIIFVLIFIPFGLYAHSLLEYSNLSAFSAYLDSNFAPLLYISLLLYPCFLMYFRILSAWQEKGFTQKKVICFSGIIICSILIICCILTFIRPKKLQKKDFVPSKTIKTYEQSEKIKFSYFDKSIFDEIVRTINIKLPENCVQCNVEVLCEQGNAILYSADDYELQNSNHAQFVIPYSPPPSISFRYGTDKNSSKINVSAIVQEKNNNLDNLQKEEFSLYTKSITINNDGN